MAAAPQLVPSPLPTLSGGILASSAARAFGSPGRGRRALRATDAAGEERLAVLVVEPDERTRSLLTAGLGREGFIVRGAATAVEAERFLAPDYPLPAMVFCEAELRGGDGFSLCGQLRADARTADLPVVLLSRSAEAWHRELAGGAGADEYLPKPVFLADVVAMALLLAGRSSAAARYEVQAERLPLPRALRALLSGVRSGRVELSDDRGWVAFRDGQLVDAAFGTARGEPALEQMLREADGEYAVVFGPSFSRPSFSVGLQEYCRRTLPRLERWRTLLDRAVPLDAVRVVDFVRLAQVLDGLPDEVNRIIRLFDGARTVEAVARDCGVDDLVALEVVTRLDALGVIVPAAPRADAREVEPALFEPAPAAVVHEPGVSEPGVAGQEAPEPPSALDEALRRQLEAFRIQIVRDSRPAPIPLVNVVRVAPPSAPAPLESFGLGNEGETVEISAFALAVESVLPQVDVAESVLPQVDEAELVPPQGDAVQPAPSVAAPARRALLPVALVALVGAAIVAAIVLPDRELAGAGPIVIEVAPPAPEPEIVAAAAAPEAIENVAPVLGPEVIAELAPVVEAIAPAPTEPVPAVDTAAQLQEGIRLYDAGRYRQAAAVLEQVTALDPAAARAWLFLGLARFDLGDGAGARAAAERVLAGDPDNGRAIMLLAAVHLDAGRKDQARDQLSRYLALHPEGPFAREARQLLR